MGDETAKLTRAALGLLLCVSCGWAADPDGETDSRQQGAGRTLALEISVSGVREVEGDVCVAVFESPRGFPDDPEAPVATACAPLARQPVRVEELVAGRTYGLSVFVDVNANRALDTKSLFGLSVPAEGFGFSMNPRIGFGVPPWDELSFTLDETTARQTVAMNYL